MRVLSLSGSHVKKGNTGLLIGYLNEQIEEAAIEDLKMKSVSLADAKIGPCKGCRKCMETGYCVVKDDFNSIARKMLKSDLLIIGSPVYFQDVSGRVKNLIDRTYSLWHDRQLKGKKVIPVAVSAVSGEDRALETLRIWAQAHEMKIIRSVYGHGYKRGEVLKDPEAKDAVITAVRDLVGELKSEH
ncbi:NAD(P)H-dependent oxidoreductase [Methanospirillum hungatei]|uniref:flavodoxin family protein n=1 Tax=Methanospirillum hungatei TaxID=2203 RepID=UPI0026ED8831|nr:NAD(P)H-dependent oxidoreductase [Methanospirillum hungatei]MCA1916017.1 flavodoxin family protein [Methanospirillum hungatei]